MITSLVCVRFLCSVVSGEGRHDSQWQDGELSAPRGNWRERGAAIEDRAMRAKKGKDRGGEPFEARRILTGISQYSERSIDLILVRRLNREPLKHACLTARPWLDLRMMGEGVGLSGTE